MWASINPESPRPHVVPIGDLVEHTIDEACVCGPEQVLLQGPRLGDRWVSMHNALDGRP